MTFFKLQTLLANISFSCLFFLMILSWINLSFSILKNKKNWEALAIFFVNICLILLLISRWFYQQHYPLSNLYESLIFLAWSITTLHLFLVQVYKFEFIGAITYPIAFFILAFAEFSLPLEMQKVISLVPALQSNWLMMHVTIMMLSYSALLLGSLFAIAFLVLNTFQKYNQQITTSPTSNSSSGLDETKNLTSTPFNITNQLIENEKKLAISFSPFTEETNRFNNLTETLDNLSYRTLGLGFPLLTIGILSGAVWANEAWGSYWSWDVKETWAFITWLVFAIYLHTRITKGWEGEKPALIATFGFFIVWICYLGVNILGQGLHSYGWFF